MRKIFYLKTCNTCQKALKFLDAGDGVELHEIKSTQISTEDLEYMRSLVDTYDDLFSKRAMKYRSLGLKEKNLSEEEMKDYILEEYTFLKRPVVVVGDQIFIGHSKKALEGAKSAIHGA